MINKEELNKLTIDFKKLGKKDIDLIITDFDDTIFSRKHQLETSDILRTNRGNKGNDAIINIIGVDNTMNDFYKNQLYPKTISSKLRKNHDLILTAGYKEIQEAKLKAVKLNHINFHVVLNAEEKIIESLKYIINELKFIPNKITVFEDRPKYFIENKDFLEDFLSIPVEIMFVEMLNNEENPKITKVG